MDNTEYNYFSKRPYHLGECLTHIKKRNIEDLNIFGLVQKTIDINGDDKRLWEKKFKKGKDCLKEFHNSLPLLYQE